MIKRIPLLLIGLTASAFFISPLQAKEQPSSAKSSWESFGVQRFQEKKEAPPFLLKDLNGNIIALKSLKGKPVLLMFWATWCPACKEEIALFEKFSMGKKDLLTMYIIPIDGEKEKKVKRVIQENKITLPVILDVKEKIARTYGVKMIPTTFLIDEESLLVAMIVGQRDWSSPEAWSAVNELFSLR